MFNQNNEMNTQILSETTGMRQYVLRTFMIMGAGLLLTSIISIILSMTGLGLQILYVHPMVPLFLFVIEIGVVFTFFSKVRKMSKVGASICFVLYACITGIVFSTLGELYMPEVIVAAFLITTVYFISLVVIGYTTKIDLLRFRTLLMAALLTFVIAQIVMSFMGASIDTKMMSVIGLVIFTGITAYDAQKMKRLYIQNAGNENMLSTLSIYSALELYLDFINMFIYILRLLGSRK